MGMEAATLQPWPQLSGILKGPDLFLSILSHLYRGRNKENWSSAVPGAGSRESVLSSPRQKRFLSSYPEGMGDAPEEKGSLYSGHLNTLMAMHWASLSKEKGL